MKDAAQVCKDFEQAKKVVESKLPAPCTDQ